MIRTLLAVCAVALTPTLAVADPGAPDIDEPGGVPQGYQLVWSDEFDHGRMPDARKWAYDTSRNAEGWYNNELQYYAARRRENVRVENGALVLEARHEDLTRMRDYGGQHFSSGKLVTRGIASWTYGFFEVRARFTCAYGSWPAIWLLANSGGWPDGGEIDIMEHVGRQPGVIHGTVHTASYNHRDQTQRTAQKEIADLCADGQFHLYQTTWTRDRITIGVDNRNYYQFSRDAEGGHGAWPFDAPEFLILNLAIGGWGGDTDQIKPEDFPQRMEVDYVRVYQAP
ncbi:MAG TPA: glycoside hydrolase family 16 protein [Caulobacterales bacterium]|nr:glycoside hydrolase family 16 protein [Caulobacterales bacterium]